MADGMRQHVPPDRREPAMADGMRQHVPPDRREPAMADGMRQHPRGRGAMMCPSAVARADSGLGCAPAAVSRPPMRTYQHLLEATARGVGGLRLRVEDAPAGVLRLRLSSRLSRWNGMEVSAYLMRSVLIDAGFAHGGALLLEALAGRTIAAIALTHHHEDHSGVAGPLAARHRCPIYLREPTRRFDEGLAQLRPYRVLWWGEPAPYEPEAMPARIPTEGGALTPMPIPGHSATHTTLFDEATGVAFTGDLYITGGATAVMSHENPYESIASLRRIADLEPRWMLTGHALTIERPAAALRAKADRIAAAAEQVRTLHAAGLPTAAIVRRVFPKGNAGDRVGAVLTSGEFSRPCFVRACLRHAG